MPQEFQKSPIVDLTKGLITEQTPFTLVPNATSNELNVEITGQGSRTRRKGIALEESFLKTNVHPTVSSTALIHTALWRNAGDQTFVDYLVVQVNSKLYLYELQEDMDAAIVIDPSTSNPFFVEMNTYAYNSLSPAEERVSVCFVDGLLVVTSPAIYPFFVEVTPTSSSGFTVTQLDVRERDLEYLGDTSTYFTKANLGGTATVAKQQRMYDTINSGWTETTIDAYATHTTTANDYPPLTHRWFEAKTALGAFDAALWETIFGGTSIVGNGRIILSVLEKDRTASYNAFAVADAISTTYVPDVVEPTSFSCVASFAGRAAYAGLTSGDGSSKVYITKVIQRPKDLEVCYQVNDPTSESFPDLRADDGVVVRIADCFNILYMYNYQNDLLVFASNGVWAIRGVDGQFQANSYFVQKITSEGVPSRFSTAIYKDTPVVFGNKSIFSVVREANGSIVTQSLSEDTIKSLLNSFGADAKSSTICVVDESNDKIYWLFNDDPTNLQSMYTFLLVFDLKFAAFNYFEVANNGSRSSTSFIASAFSYGNTLKTEVQSELVDSSGDTIIDDSSDTVVISDVGFIDPGPSGIKFVVFWNGIEPDGTNYGTKQIRFATFRSLTYKDWWDAVSGGGEPLCFFETSFNPFSDLHNYKEVKNLTVYNKIENVGWKKEFTNYSNLIFSTQGLSVKSLWDFRTDTGLVSSYVDCLTYREDPISSPDTPDTTPWTYPISHTYNQVMLEGRGRILNLRFLASTGKGFNMIGFETVGSRNREFDN